jgi:hypothetical protein
MTQTATLITNLKLRIMKLFQKILKIRKVCQLILSKIIFNFIKYKVQCGEHQTFTNCLPSCPLTCAFPTGDVAATCLGGCFGEGCACDDGYLQDDNNNCVLPSDCPSTQGRYSITLVFQFS